MAQKNKNVILKKREIDCIRLLIRLYDFSNCSFQCRTTKLKKRTPTIIGISIFNDREIITFWNDLQQRTQRKNQD